MTKVGLLKDRSVSKLLDGGCMMSLFTLVFSVLSDLQTKNKSRQMDMRELLKKIPEQLLTFTGR